MFLWSACLGACGNRVTLRWSNSAWGALERALSSRRCRQELLVQLGPNQQGLSEAGVSQVKIASARHGQNQPCTSLRCHLRCLHSFAARCEAAGHATCARAWGAACLQTKAGKPREHRSAGCAPTTLLASVRFTIWASCNLLALNDVFTENVSQVLP